MFRRRLRAVSLAAMLFAFWCGAASMPFAQDAPTSQSVDLARDFPVLTGRAKDQQASDFVIAIDYSISMRPFWKTVREGVIAFIKAVPDNDYISLVTFGKDAVTPVVPRRVTSDSRRALIEEFSLLGEPQDQWTDLGKGMQVALDELNRPNSNRLKFVFLFTDFFHEPPPHSVYVSASPQHEAWSKLAQRQANEQAGRTVQAFGLMLPLGKNAGLHFETAKSVFPNLVRVTADTDALGAWFQTKQAEIARDKLRALVERDARSQPFTLTGLAHKGDQVVATLEPNRNRIVDTEAVYNVEVSELNAGQLAGRLTPLPTGGLKHVPAQGGTHALEVPLFQVGGGSSILRWSEEDKVSFKLKATQDIEPEAEITHLNLPASQSFELPVEGRALALTGGYVPLWSIFAVLLFIAACVAALLYHRRQEYIVGEFIVPGKPPLTLNDRSRRKIFEIGKTTEAKGIRIEGVNWTLYFESLQPPKRPRGVYVRVARARATLDRPAREGREVAHLNDQQGELAPRGSDIKVESKTVKFN
ncbi:MAG TPA: vWA domain-containing protein [Pyrinomonadaceae bacterium]|nr:vWA domain-containing protein [Pyrinomonadaceae bacterium]